MRTLTPVLCTSGLAAEARVARAAGFQVIVGAGDPERTTALVKDAARDAKCLVSFGVAGGLAPHLAPGHVILSAEVIGDDQRWRPNELFRRQIAGLAGRIGAVEGPVLGSRAILATEDDKLRAWRDTGALAVDLESAIVARAAEAAGSRFWCCAPSPIRRPGIASGGPDPACRKRHASLHPGGRRGDAPAAPDHLAVRSRARDPAGLDGPSRSGPRAAARVCRDLGETSPLRRDGRRRIRPAAAGRAGFPVPSHRACAPA